RAAAKKALEIDNALAEAHATLGRISMFYDWDWIRAENEFREAIELKPNYATAHHWYGTCLRIMEKFEEAITEAKLAMELDPLSLIIQTNLATHFYCARRYDEAIKHFRKAMDMDQNFYAAHNIGLPL